MDYYFDAFRQVVGSGDVPYTVKVQITQDAWDKADAGVQQQAKNILNNEPIRLLPINGTGNGFKLESNGWTIHTQSNKRLYDKSHAGSKKPGAFLFDEYRKPPKH